MLLRFGVSNHRSIKEYQELILTASSLKDSETGLLHPFKGDDAPESSKSVKVLPVIAIYGANAAGKSTVLKALDYYVGLIRSSHARVASRVGVPYSPFLLDDDSKDAPSAYDADFVVGGVRYHYGYSIDGERVLSEWLYSYSSVGKRQSRKVLFHRDSCEDCEYYFGKSLKGENKIISKLTRDNVLFLSAAAQNSHPQLSPIYDYFNGGFSTRMEISGRPELIGPQVAMYFGEKHADRQARALEFLKRADVGIAGISFSKVPFDDREKALLEDLDRVFQKHLEVDTAEFDKNSKVEIELLHAGEEGKSYKIKLKDESSGTLAILQVLGPVFSRLIDGGVLIVDELNVSLHPLVSKELIRLFSSPKTNPGGAQLIFSTHDTSMLMTGLLRRDQIWFAEKDGCGATNIYSLGDINVRATDNFERGYIDGHFGAVPLFGVRGGDFSSFGVAHELDVEGGE